MFAILIQFLFNLFQRQFLSEWGKSLNSERKLDSFQTSSSFSNLVLIMKKARLLEIYSIIIKCAVMLKEILFLPVRNYSTESIFNY